MALLFAKIDSDKWLSKAASGSFVEEESFYWIDRASNGLLSRALKAGFLKNPSFQEEWLVLRPRWGQFSIIVLSAKLSKSFKWADVKHLAAHKFQAFVNEAFTKNEFEKGKEHFPDLDYWRPGAVEAAASPESR